MSQYHPRFPYALSSTDCSVPSKVGSGSSGSSASPRIVNSWKNVRAFGSILALFVWLGAGCDGCSAPADPNSNENRAACTFNSDCTDGYCDGGFCTPGLEPGTCRGDNDCAGEDICLVPEGSDIGACVYPHACDVDTDCADPEQVCADLDGDGFRDCVFAGCADDAECAVELADSCSQNETPRCLARACVCRDYCGAPCADGQQCCGDAGTFTCQPDLGPCADLQCEPGFGGVTEDPGEWLSSACGYPSAICNCAELPPLPTGEVGTPHVLVESVAGDRFVVAYNRTYGDVVVASANASPVSGWVHVDGVPPLSAEAPIVAGPSGPRGGIDALGDDVGSALDAVLAPDGTLHIVAYDATAGSLRWIHGPAAGPFVAETLDDTGDVGHAVSIAITDAGLPVVTAVAGRTGSANTELRLLAAPTTTAAPTSWASYVLASAPLSAVDCEGGCQAGFVCPEALPDTVATCVTEANNCTCASGEVCTASGCLVEAKAASRSKTLVANATSVVAGGGALAVFAHDGRLGQLVGYRQSSGTASSGSGVFASNVIDDGGSDDVGGQPDAASTGGTGYVVAHVNATARQIILTQVDTSLAAQSTATIDSGERPHPSGAIDAHHVDLPSVSLANDGSGVIAWQDGTDGTVRARQRASDGRLGPTLLLAGGELEPNYNGTYLSVATAGGDVVSAQRVVLAEEPPLFEVVTYDAFMACPADDVQEPNDALATASTFPADGVVQGIICGNEDWYSISVDAGCTVAATLFFRNADGDLDLYLQDTSDTNIATSNSVLDAERITKVVATSGTYALRVAGFSGANNAYVLRVDTSCP